MAFSFQVSLSRQDRWLAIQTGGTGQSMAWSLNDVTPALQDTVGTVFIHGVRIRVQTSAVAGNRRGQLRMTLGAQELLLMPAGGTIPANSDGRFHWLAGGEAVATTPSFRDGSPILPMLAANQSLAASIVGALAGDVLSEMVLWGILEPK